MCGLDIQEFIDQFFNSASCMGPVPSEFLGKGYVTSGKWEAQGGLPANMTAEMLNEAWNNSYWPVIAGADAGFVATHGLTGENTSVCDGGVNYLMGMWTTPHGEQPFRRQCPRVP